MKGFWGREDLSNTADGDWRGYRLTLIIIIIIIMTRLEMIQSVSITKLCRILVIMWIQYVLYLHFLCDFLCVILKMYFFNSWWKKPFLHQFHVCKANLSCNIICFNRPDPLFLYFHLHLCWPVLSPWTHLPWKPIGRPVEVSGRW